MHEMGLKQRNNKGSTSEKASYTTTILLEEVASLRRKVKELEDDQSSSGAHSSPSVQSSQSNSFLDDIIAGLRKDLSKSQNEKANMELEFMNQLSKHTRDNNDAVEELKAKMAEAEAELVLLRDARPLTKDEATLEIERLKEIHESEMNQIKDDLAAADKELEVLRKDADEMLSKIKSNDDEKKLLADEISDTRLQVENGAIAVSILRSEIENLENHHKAQVVKFESQIKEHSLEQSRHQDELAKANSMVLKMENAKSMLLDEITDLRMQLDREDDTKDNLLKKIEELNKLQGQGGAIIASLTAEQRAKDAETKITELEKANQKAQTELREMTTSYKTDVARLEEAVSSNEAKAEQLKLDVKRKEIDLADVIERCNILEKELKAVKADLAAAAGPSAESSNSRSHLVVDEERMSRDVSGNSTDTDAVKIANLVLKSEVKKLKKSLGNEKESSERLKMEIIGLKAATIKGKGPTTSLNTRPMSPSPSYMTSSGKNFAFPGGSSSPVRNYPPPSPIVSPKLNSVRALAAAFEPVVSPRADFVGLKPIKGKSETALTISQEAEELREQGLSVYDLERKIEEIEARQHTSLEQKMEEIKELQGRLNEEVEKNTAMEEKLKSQSIVIGQLRAEVATLSATRTAIQTQSRHEYEEQSTTDREEILRLRTELEKANDAIEVEKKEITNLQEEIRDLTLERMNQEEDALGSYDQKVKENRKTFNSEINNLQLQITKERMRNSKLESDYQIQVKELEDTIEELNLECDRELDEKQAELDMLKHKLDENSDTIKQLESEREQICMSMNSQSNSRKEQFDELEAELMQQKAANATLSREIEKLTMHIHQDEEVTEELERLREKVNELQGKQRPTNSATIKFMENVQLDEIKVENEKLRSSLRQTTIERRALQEKINSLINEKSESRSVEVLRERNEQLKQDVAKLQRKIQKLERNRSRIEV